MSTFEFAEYRLTITAESLDEAKKILKAEIEAGNVCAQEVAAEEAKPEVEDSTTDEAPKQAKKSK